MQENIWYEKYRPKKLDDVAIPPELIDRFKKYIKDENIPNMGLFSVSPGTGKGSLINAIIHESGLKVEFINASLERSIDVIRGQISRFVSSKSMLGGVKLVVLDEADNYSADGQKAFRGFIDEFSGKCRFLFTGNYSDKIIDPLLNRLEVYDFDSFDRNDVIKPIYMRLSDILNQENIEHSQEDIVTIINTYYPSVRGMIGSLQRFSVDGKLTVDNKMLASLHQFDNLLNILFKKDYNVLYNEIININAPSAFYKYMFSNLNKFDVKKRPQITIILAKYQHMDGTVRDKNLNLAACCVEIASCL
jgi:replication factor C small subunit